MTVARVAAGARPAVRWSAESQVLGDGPGRLDLVHGVEVNAGRPVVQQCLAELRHHFNAELDHAVTVVTETLKALTDPARDLRSAVF